MLWPAGTDLSKTPSGIARAALMTEGRRKLWEFLNDWSGQLAQAEKIVSMWGVSPPVSCMDTIDQAKDALTKVLALITGRK